MNKRSTRREFVAKAVSGAAACSLVAGASPRAFVRPATAGPPALLGGQPVRTQPFPSWPVIAENDRDGWLEVLGSRKWCRLDGNHVSRFEQAWSKALGASHCLATASGTTALSASLNALDVGPGDEVIVPPYTFVATVNVVLLQHALPVFVDTDRNSFQIDAGKIEAAITPRTRVLLPVHLGGSTADLDRILAIAAKHGLPVLEDACQAHLAEWRHKKVSTLGALGCFSFQASKNLNSGEGGAILTNDGDLYGKCLSFYNNGRGSGNYAFNYVRNGCNHRMTEFQGALLHTQLARLDEQARTREQNAQYLTGRLKEIPGLDPAHMYEGCTRNAYHLYMFRYDPSGFSGLPRAAFLKALEAEGIPCSPGYTPLNKEPFLENTLNSRAYRRIYSETELAAYRERNHCPENDRLCQEAVWFTQNMLIGPRSDMDQIADAVLKIQKHAPELAKS
jgi:dTDP-4-amino-4,6-dideoxygalactose transaminase